MHLAEELTLLVKSKYPLIYLESADEDYALRQLAEIAGRLRLIHYRWSLTEGLRRAGSDGSYYQTNEPVKMLRTAIDLIRRDASPGLFVLKDFHRCLEDQVVLRLFKDLLGGLANLPDTVVILAADYQLPKEIEPSAAHIVGGYPDETEICACVKDLVDETVRYNRQIKVSLTPAESKGLVRALKGLTLQQIRNVIAQAIVEDGALDGRDFVMIEACKKKVFDQEGLLEYHAGARVEDIAGFANLKNWLAERRASFIEDSSPVLPPPKGLLLLGVQGCGKSLAVKAIATELGLPLYQLDLGRLYSKYIGETEQNLRKALAVAERLSPLCLWIDEIEKGFAASAGETDGGVSQRVLGTFLTWMQERTARCFVAATANDVYRLPPEFLRKGRFDEVFFVDLPNAATRKTIFALHLGKRGLPPADFDLETLAEKTADFSGAEIEQVILAALYSASHRHEHIITDLLLAKIGATKPLAVLKSEDVNALREWARERTVPV